MNNMLKNQAYIFALALLLAACTRVQPAGPGGEEAGAPREITLAQPLVAPSTKAFAGEMPLDYSTDESFGVFALYYPSGNFAGWETTPGAFPYIDGAEFSYDSSIDDSSAGSGAWSANPGYYWPKGGKMTFAAYSPYRAADASAAIAYTAAGLQLTDFSTADKGPEQYDLMYSARVYDKADCTGASASYDGIDLVFRHALSSVHFRARSSVSTATIKITKIVIYDIAKTGDFSENVDESSPATYSSSPVWDLSGKATYTEAAPLVVYEDKSGTAPALPSDGSTFIPIGSALPIPQGLGSAKLKVYYSIQLGSADPVPTVSQPLPLSGTSGTDPISEWKMQTRYTYSLILGAQQIRFSVDVRGWQDGDPIETQ